MGMIDDLLGRNPVREDSAEPPIGTYRQQRPSSVRQLPPKDKEEDKLKKKARLFWLKKDLPPGPVYVLFSVRGVFDAFPALELHP